MYTVEVGSIRASRLVAVLCAALAITVLLGSARAPGQTGYLYLDLPVAGTVFQPGQAIEVTGAAIQSDGTPIVSVDVNVRLEDGQGSLVPDTVQTLTTSTNGRFFFGLPIPSGLPDGEYVVRVSSTNASITAQAVGIVVRSPFAPPLVAIMSLAAAGIVAAALLALWLARRAPRSPRRILR